MNKLPVAEIPQPYAATASADSRPFSTTAGIRMPFNQPKSGFS